jgi:hypothetical protein
MKKNVAQNAEREIKECRWLQALKETIVPATCTRARAQKTLKAA